MTGFAHLEDHFELPRPSRERILPSWYDGTATGSSPTNPNATQAPGTNPTASPGTTAPPGPMPRSGINVGYNPALGAATTPWLPASLTNFKFTGAPNGTAAIGWGPSSDHSNGAVMHVFGDDHVIPITNACDAATYLNLTTRAGSESIDSSLIN